jgi:hypothetical protein
MSHTIFLGNFLTFYLQRRNLIDTYRRFQCQLLQATVELYSIIIISTELV